MGLRSNRLVVVINSVRSVDVNPGVTAMLQSVIPQTRLEALVVIQVEENLAEVHYFFWAIEVCDSVKPRSHSDARRSADDVIQEPLVSKEYSDTGSLSKSTTVRICSEARSR